MSSELNPQTEILKAKTMNPTTFSSTQNLAVRIADRLYPVVGHATGYELSEVGPLFLETFVLEEGNVKELSLVAKGRPYRMFGVTPQQWVEVANGGDTAIQLGDNRQGLASPQHEKKVVEKFASKLTGFTHEDLAKEFGHNPDSESFKKSVQKIIDDGLIQRVHGTGTNGETIEGYQLAL